MNAITAGPAPTRTDSSHSDGMRIGILVAHELSGEEELDRAAEMLLYVLARADDDELPYDLETVLERLEARIGAAYEAVKESAREMHVDLRTAAYEIVVRRVLRAIELRGF